MGGRVNCCESGRGLESSGLWAQQAERWNAVEWYDGIDEPLDLPSEEEPKPNAVEPLRRLLDSDVGLADGRRVLSDATEEGTESPTPVEGPEEEEEGLRRDMPS